ncbi:DNA-binding protein Ewg-like isoform X2 [Onthophagus taurus]|uniref:DNA-binding protein Ewg-like isoform X2 n=1 Tax=Onthophagus taurus TaxID=166361 RepID=UPI0039BE3F12
MNSSNGCELNKYYANMDDSSSISSSDSSDSDDEETTSSSQTSFDEEDDSITSVIGHEVTTELAVSGPVGVAAATAIASVKSYKKPHLFETNPIVRRRQRTRLFRKFQILLDEFSLRVGQQAVVLVASPGDPNGYYKVIGAKPLKNVFKNLRSIVMEEFQQALSHEAPTLIADDTSRFHLPSLVIDGIPTPVQKMTQVQLRTFIPLMLKYALGRSKPGWGKESLRPPWWPTALPWANVRTDPRNEREKQKMCWTDVLREVVLSCYKYHNREDLLDLYLINSDGSEMVDDPPPMLTDDVITQVEEEGTSVKTDIINNEDVPKNVCLNCVTEAYATNKQIILTTKNGLHITGDGMISITPVLRVSKDVPNSETLTVAPVSPKSNEKIDQLKGKLNN